MATTQKSQSNRGRSRRPAVADAGLPVRGAEAKTQLGARISETKYRQLKLAAVLRGVTVQVLVEQAIQEFLANHPELLQSSLVASPSKPASRKTR
jgi:hypothetical protein